MRERFSRWLTTTAGEPDPLAGECESPGEIRFRWWWFALLFAVVALLLAFREPSGLRKPSFVAEDGFAFFKQNYEEPFWRIVFRPHAGYVQLVQRLIAAVAGFAPLESLPLIYALSALFIAAAAMTFFVLPSFRPVVGSDVLRAVVVLTLPFMPNADGLMRVCAVHWYLLLFLVLVSMMRLPKNGWAAGGLWMAATASFWSQPVAIVCVPVLIFRLWRAGPGAERRWWLALAVVAVAYPFTAQSQSVIAALWHTPGVLLSLLHAIGYRVFCFFVLGQDVSRLALAEGWLLATRLSLLSFAVCAAWAWRPGQTRPRWTRTALVMLSYYVLALPVPYVLRVEIIPDFLMVSENAWLAHQRYFCVSVLSLCILCGVAYQSASRDWRRHAAAGLLLLCWLGLHTPSYRLWDFQSHPGWPHFARHIRRCEELAQRTGVGTRVAIQTTPYIFVLDVGSPPPSARPEW